MCFSVNKLHLKITEKKFIYAHSGKKLLQTHKQQERSIELFNFYIIPYYRVRAARVILKMWVNFLITHNISYTYNKIYKKLKISITHKINKNASNYMERKI